MGQVMSIEELMDNATRNVLQILRKTHTSKFDLTKMSSVERSYANKIKLLYLDAKL